MCASTQRLGARGSRSKEGIRAMTKLFRSTDAAEIFALEHRFPLAATLFAMFVTGNIGSAVMMLLAQG